MFAGLSFDPLHYPNPSRRNVVYAKNGMVAASQPLAAEAGLEILKRGGNAVDAAIATAAALTVVEPTANGIGGDNFAIVWIADPSADRDASGGVSLHGSTGRLYGMNASGPAPALLSLEELAHRGIHEMPRRGFIPVTVPGAPAGWAALSQRFGRLPFADLLAPAIAYAEDGYPISPTLGKFWGRAVTVYKRDADIEELRPWFDTFTVGGRAPIVGQVWRSPDHARTLRAIAQSSARDFYEGDLADAIDRFSRATGGLLRKSDLRGFKPEFVHPISVHYRGFDVWELPPNGQGLVALMALNLLQGFDLSELQDATVCHLAVEAMKLAFADGLAYIGDPRRVDVPVDYLLSQEYVKLRRARIGKTAGDPRPGQVAPGGTVYMATADGEGNMVSFIQSNYHGFGSGVVVPGTGIALNDRGSGFRLDPGHPNCLEPGKRPYHTIIPGFLSRENYPVGPFGVMGGFMQPQGHVQLVMNSVDFHLNPQAALDAPRWQWITGNTVEVETSLPIHIAKSLTERGHAVVVPPDEGGFGRGQAIWRDGATGVLCGGTEQRTDGAIAAW